MDNNMNINPEKMEEIARSIAVVGQKYQTKVTELFNNVDQMNQCWQGQEYDAMKNKFAQSKPALVELGELVNVTIPKNINTAVSNYNQAQNKIRNMFN